MTTTLDTQRMVKRLTQAGLAEPLAETLVDVVREAQTIDIGTLATKADLDAGLTELRGDRARLKAVFANGRLDTQKPRRRMPSGLAAVGGGCAV
jgi:hypothetical protein